MVLLLILLGKLALKWQYIFGGLLLILLGKIALQYIIGGSVFNITWKASVAVVVYL